MNCGVFLLCLLLLCAVPAFGSDCQIPTKDPEITAKNRTSQLAETIRHCRVEIDKLEAARKNADSDNEQLRKDIEALRNQAKVDWKRYKRIDSQDKELREETRELRKQDMLELQKTIASLMQPDSSKIKSTDVIAPSEATSASEPALKRVSAPPFLTIEPWNISPDKYTPEACKRSTLKALEEEHAVPVWEQNGYLYFNLEGRRIIVFCGPGRAGLTAISSTDDNGLDALRIAINRRISKALDAEVFRKD